MALVILTQQDRFMRVRGEDEVPVSEVASHFGLDEVGLHLKYQRADASYQTILPRVGRDGIDVFPPLRPPLNARVFEGSQEFLVVGFRTSQGPSASSSGTGSASHLNGSASHASGSQSVYTRASGNAVSASLSSHTVSRSSLASASSLPGYFRPISTSVSSPLHSSDVDLPEPGELESSTPVYQFPARRGVPAPLRRYMYEPYTIAHTGRRPPPGASKRKSKGMKKDIELVTLSSGGDISTQMIMTVNLDESSGTRSVGAQIERQLRARNPTDTSKVLIMNTKNIPISDENSGTVYWGGTRRFRAIRENEFRMWNPDGYEAYMGRSNYPTPHVEDEILTSHEVTSDTSEATSHQLLVRQTPAPANSDILNKVNEVIRTVKSNNELLTQNRDQLLREERQKLSDFKRSLCSIFKCPICLDTISFPAVMHPACRRIIGCERCVRQIQDTSCPLCRGDMSALDEDRPRILLPDLTELLSDDQGHSDQQPVVQAPVDPQLADTDDEEDLRPAFA